MLRENASDLIAFLAVAKERNCTKGRPAAVTFANPAWPRQSCSVDNQLFKNLYQMLGAGLKRSALPMFPAKFLNHCWTGSPNDQRVDVPTGTVPISAYS